MSFPELSRLTQCWSQRDWRFQLYAAGFRRSEVAGRVAQLLVVDMAAVKRISKLLKLFGIFLSLVLLLHSLTMADPIRPQLPADVTMNNKAGRGGWLIVTLRLESGEELPFMVDTGSPTTLLTKSLEPKLGKRLDSKTIWTFGGKQEAGIYEAPKFYLGSTPLMIGSNIFACDFLKKLSSQAGSPIVGVLGMDCLRHYCIQLDFEAGKMRFLDSDHVSVTGLGKAFPLSLSSDFMQPLIKHSGLIGGTSTNSVIDTGCNIDGLAEGSAIKRHASGSYSGGFLKRIEHFLAVEGMVNRGVSLQRCVWDGNTYTNITVGRAPSDSPSWIGLRFLARHVVTLDFPKQMMYLKQTNVGPLTGEKRMKQPNNTLEPTATAVSVLTDR